jgi:cobalt-zinc-cadmium resistance protein CzcA
MLPSLSAGYNNTSIRGWQRSSMDPEQYFDYSKRFSSVNVGVGIPIFYTAQKARINAASKAIEQRKQELAAITQEISGNLQNAVRTYLQRRNTVYIYRNAMLPNAASIITSANNKLALGEISYLNWVMLINQAVQVRNDYFNTIEQMNEAAIEIERLSAIN